MARITGVAIALQLFHVPSSSCLQYAYSFDYGLQCMSFLREAWCLAMQVGYVKACSLLVLYGLFVVLVLAADIHHRIR